MSKVIKQMQMDALKSTFHDVRDMVILSTAKLSCAATHTFRSNLRKKNVRVQMVKNSLCQRVFDELGMKVDGCWSGPTMVAWGGNSLSELSKDIEGLIKKNANLQVKAAVSEGQVIDFKAALKMPTKPEAIGRVLSLALSPASRLVSQILAPASVVAGQIKTLAERPVEAPAAEAAPAETPAAPTPA